MDNVLIIQDVPSSHYSFEVRSSIGGRSEQQDFAGVLDCGSFLFAVVCDGMGGEQQGKIASKIATRVALQRAAQFCYSENAADFLHQILQMANEEVFSRLLGNGGSTLVMALLCNDELYWASAGDSRLYIYRNGELLQVTRDHNYRLMLDEMLMEGDLSSERYEEESAKGDALISFVGSRKLQVYDLTENAFKLNSNDILLLATDGLFNVLSNHDIMPVLKDNNLSLSDKANSLEQMLMQEMEITYQDNATFVLIKII